MTQLRIENHELTKLIHERFPFGCYTMLNQETFPHWHDHHEIVYVHEATCTVHVNGIPLLCQEGELLFIPGGSLHGILPTNQSKYTAIVLGDTLFKELSVDLHVSGSLSIYFSDQLLGPIKITRHCEAYPQLQSDILQVIHYYLHQTVDFELYIKIALLAFLLRLKPSLPTIEDPQVHHITTQRTIAILKKSIAYITTHYQEKLTIEKLSTQCNMSAQHFCRLFKNYTGKTVIEYLLDLRIAQANLLLTSSDIPITRIPEMTGFCNPNYFSRMYKLKMGCTPSLYRKRSMANQNPR